VGLTHLLPISYTVEYWCRCHHGKKISTHRHTHTHVTQGILTGWVTPKKWRCGRNHFS